ncbi:hypothetical protein O4158_21940 [Gordonia amicalis]|uniref:hypothetical protein n=1 Tax=Gordonia amicalis TaxID=89053 RepID=UPI0022B4D44C|nr:hypothetical protein [Gordonia amicalis]MCZ4581699.1 hypothetical protein [Gordonia amicalis]
MLVVIITHEDRNRFRDFIAPQDGQRPPDSHYAALIEAIDSTAVSDYPHYTAHLPNDLWQTYIATERGIVYVTGEAEAKPVIRFYPWSAINKLTIEALDPVSTGNQDQPEFPFAYEFDDFLSISARGRDFVVGARKLWRESGNSNAY